MTLLRPHMVLASFLAAALVAVGHGQLRGQVLRYAHEYPVMAYETANTTDVVARLAERIARGELELEWEARRGYLRSLLGALDVSSASQILVFSKTSLQSPLITAATPRAIYFDDDVYVAWVPGAESIEIAAMDPNLGPVFYTLELEEDATPRFQRETVCLECHDSYGLTGGGVPRFLIGSGVTSPRGQTVYHGGWNLTTDRTPLERRWGGWYVTGTHGSMRHMGNVAVLNAAQAEEIDLRGGDNVTDLSALLDPGPYLTAHSDIVALLVVEHQITVQNLITRANWEARTALYDNRNVGLGPDEVGARLDQVVEPLVRALVFSGEAPLPSSVEGTTQFRERFERRGPRDAAGRSLRQLRLEGRLFRYPVSYQIHSDAFAALPEQVKSRVFQRIVDIVGGVDRSPELAHARGPDGAAALDVLRSTHDDFRQWYEAR